MKILLVECYTLSVMGKHAHIIVVNAWVFSKIFHGTSFLKVISSLWSPSLPTIVIVTMMNTSYQLVFTDVKPTIH